MRKTIVYLVVLAALGTGVYFLLPSGTNEEPFKADQAGFTIKDTAAVGRIFISDAGGESVLVERTDSGWMVNHQYHALPSTLNMLLTTMLKQEALYPVTKAAHDNVIKLLSTHGIKTEVYDRAGKKLKVFYVGGGAADNNGTNMLLEGASQPYVVETPGFVGYLTPRYSYRLRDWRDRTIFNVPASDIRSISVQYAGKPDESFTVTQEANDSVDVKATAAATNKGPLNSRRAHSYLRFFSNINCEGYLNGLEDNDTTLMTAPKHSSIALTTRSGAVQHVDIYWMAINKRSKNRKSSDMPNEVSEDYDSDRMYAVMNNYQDTIMIQQLSFQNIFRKAGEFYTADAPAPTRQ